MQLKKILKKLKLAESTISTLLGILVVLVVGVLIFKYFQNLGKPLIPKEGVPEETVEKGEKETQVYRLPVDHIVAEGENLWKIAEKYYDSGYNWVDIAKENNLKKPNIVFSGIKLKIPEVRRRIPLEELTKESKSLEPITSENYTVIKGDNLWTIALRAYGDGFRWEEIAKANNLSNPNLIHPGNSLAIPR